MSAAEDLTEDPIVAVQRATGLPVRADGTAECRECLGTCTFDPLLVGDTVGGLALRGWWVCSVCAKGWHAGKKAAVVDSKWKVNSGGRSLDTGRYRLRVDGADKDTPAFLARLATLPALEVRVLELDRELATVRGDR